MLVTTLSHPPAIGQLYEVPAVLAVFEIWAPHHEMFAEERWWPYRGPPHDDAPFGAYEPHLHFDARFLDRRQMLALRKLYRKVLSESSYRDVPLSSAPYNVAIRASHVREKGTRVLRCRREDVPFENENTREMLEALLSYDERARCWEIRDGHCPHKGYDLRSTPRSADGCVTCPLHQLRFDKEGKLVV